MLNEHDLDRAFPTPDADATAALRARLAIDADAAGLLDVACRTVDSPFGPLLIAVTDAGVARVAFEREDHERVLAHLATDISPRILREVLEHLRAIAYGRTESYAEVARAAGRPAAVRAAASACSHNPVPVVVPCHRVVRSDGSIGQYLGGPEMKAALLAMEAA